MQTVIPLQAGQAYHVYNRGVNRTDLFREERNYAYFLRLYARHINPVAATYAYCLLGNHFHFLVRIRENALTGAGAAPAAPVTPARASKAFNNLFTAYAKAINKAYDRTGALFQHHFGRQLVASEGYFAALLRYIHHNPQKHGFVRDWRQWPHSSYHALSSNEPTCLERAELRRRFGGARGLQEVLADENLPAGVADDDPDL
jgi:REP element-mobilizing transposase RayT